MKNEFTDEPFDVVAVEAGAWVPGPYGPNDQRGSLNEVTPLKTATAIALLDVSRPIKCYNLSEIMYEGFPAYGGRTYHQELLIIGYEPPPEFAGILRSPTPEGLTRVSTHEERVTLTYNIGTKVNGLHHVGVGAMFYNGFTGPSIARTWGTTKLGNETTGPVVTRGVVIDVIGLKVAHGLTSAYFLAPNGEPVLRSNYRITIEDIEASLDNSNISEPIGPGDVALIRTGWRHLIEDAPEQYINGAPPGPYLRECRYLASSRPAIVGSDTWCFELQDPAVHNGAFSPCHQELSMKYGIRVAEAIPTDELVEDGAFEFVFCFCPQNARGAVTGSSPPIALGQPSAKSGAGPNCPPAPKHDNQAWLRS